MKELMMALMLWGSSFTGLPMPEQLPEIKMVERCQMFHMQRAGEPCPEPDAGGSPLALYIAGTIYLQETWEYDNLRDVTVLLHEMVHHVQYHAALEWGPPHQPGCMREVLEKPAYEAQFAFLESAGVEDPYEFMGVNKLYVFYMTKCLPEGA